VRDIRFKAWDKKNKRFIADGESMDLYYSAKCNAFMFDNDNYDLDSNVVFLQYAGLADKYNKKICECSYVRCFGVEKPSRVIFHNGAFGYIPDEHTGFVSFAGNHNFKWKDGRSEHIEVVEDKEGEN